jgi:hypothetical protein
MVKSMVMLFFNENTGDAKVVGYCDGWKASSKKRELEKSGYKMVAKGSGKYFEFEYVVYKCEKHNKYEIYYFIHDKKYPPPKWMLFLLKTIEVLSNCELIREFGDIDYYSYSYFPLALQEFQKFGTFIQKLKEKGKIHLIKLVIKHGKDFPKLIRNAIENVENISIEDFEVEFVRKIIKKNL